MRLSPGSLQRQLLAEIALHDDLAQAALQAAALEKSAVEFAAIKEMERQKREWEIDQANRNVLDKMFAHEQRCDGAMVSYRVGWSFFVGRGVGCLFL